MRRAQIVIALAAGCVSVLLIGTLAVRWLNLTPPPPPAWATDYDLSTQPPEQIAPGTVVEQSAPAGWSHLVIKSLPRVRPSEIPKVPSPPLYGRDAVVQQCAWMFTVFAADVVKEQRGSHVRYRLRAIGLGLGANVNGRDIVLTVETAEQFGQKLRFEQSETLKTGYKVQKQSRVVVHGPSFALIDTPVTFRCGDKNKMVRFRYGLLVDPATGRLDVFAWRLGAEDGQCGDLTRAVLLKPNCIDEAELIPDLAEFSALNIPNERAFGVDDLPPYRLERTIPAEVRDLAGQTRFTPEEARTLEDALRQLLPPQ